MAAGAFLFVSGVVVGYLGRPRIESYIERIRQPKQ